ncbi:MAG: hypothetical protein RL156_796 [Bacteroidota bacterium]
MSGKSPIELYLEQQRILTGAEVFVSADIPDYAEYAEYGNDVPAVEVEQRTALSNTLNAPVSASQDLHNSQYSQHITQDDMKKTTKWQNADSLPVLEQSICTCTKCSLAETRTKFVFGSGNPHADIVVIGEAPGADEDASGLPFVGRAGQLLTKILESVNFSREEVFICNILKCRPPNNRRPLPEEVDLCEPFLFKQLELIQPKFILALGLTAVDTLLRDKHKMADIRGSFFSYRDVRMLVTYHPAALLRNPEWKRAAWEDIKLLRRSYDEYKSTGRLPDMRPL